MAKYEHESIESYCKMISRRGVADVGVGLTVQIKEKVIAFATLTAIAGQDTFIYQEIIGGEIPIKDEAGNIQISEGLKARMKVREQQIIERLQKEKPFNIFAGCVVL